MSMDKQGRLFQVGAKVIITMTVLECDSGPSYGPIKVRIDGPQGYPAPEFDLASGQVTVAAEQ